MWNLHGNLKIIYSYPLHQIFEIFQQIICSSISTLSAFRRGPNIISFCMTYPSSCAPSLKKHHTTRIIMFGSRSFKVSGHYNLEWSPCYDERSFHWAWTLDRNTAKNNSYLLDRLLTLPHLLFLLIYTDETFLIKKKNVHTFYFIFLNTTFCIKSYVPREPRRDPSNRRLCEHGICIWPTTRNRTSQPVSSHEHADSTRPQSRTLR